MTSDLRGLLRILSPLRRRIAMMIRRSDIPLVNDKHRTQTVQLNLFKGEVRDGVERIQDYGLSTVPLPGCKAVAVCADGECGHEMVIAANDGRYRPVDLAPGDVMLYTDANKKDGADTEHHLHLQPAERVITARTKTFIIDADEMIEIRTKDGQNSLRIGAGYGIRLTVAGGFGNGGSDIRMHGGKIWEYAADEIIRRTAKNITEIPPDPVGETRGPTMPE